jgi:PAS domain S-box-containing protein
MEIPEQEKETPPQEAAGRRIPLDRILALDPLKIALIYLVFGIFWIIFSDNIFLSLAERQEDVIFISSIKGVLFIAVTTVLLFLLIRHFSRKLQERDRQMNAMATNIPGVIYRFCVSPDGSYGFDYLSGRSRQILGLENDPATFFDRITAGIVPEDRERFFSSVRQAVSTKTRWEFESRYCKPSGKKIWISAVSNPVMENDILVFDGVVFDNTERKKAEEELKAAYGQLTAQEEELRAQYDALSLSQAEWETTFDAISDWITLISPDGRILRSNRTVESLLGVPLREVFGRNCFELVHGTACPVEQCPRRLMLVSGKREIAEIPMRDGSGWMQVTVDPVTNAAGEVVSAVHVVRDITEQMRSQKALEQAKKKLNLLNYVTFNDIQNMIFTVSGYQQLAKNAAKECPAGELIAKEDEILQKISHSLKFAQSYQDLGLKPPQWQNANRVFLLSISHLDFLRINHTVLLDGLEIFADPLLEQVFQILADNVLIHGKTATQVTLSSTTGPDAVTLFFEDNGVGIPEDTKIRMFSPDFQKQKGVGLFLAREILEITGITIRETGTPGKGARFEIMVPKGAYRFTEE